MTCSSRKQDERKQKMKRNLSLVRLCIAALGASLLMHGCGIGASAVHLAWGGALFGGRLAKRQCIPENPPLYLVIDLSAGPGAPEYPCRLSEEPPDLSNDRCRTVELWLRRIPAGRFVMGSPKGEGEPGGRPRLGETQRLVTLTDNFFIGVFEVTWAQWMLVTGKLSARAEEYQHYSPDRGGDCGPVSDVSYSDIRGRHKGAGWPSGGHAVDGDSFMGQLRARTGMEFDLPTSAQWEYACRAGTTSAFNSGEGIIDTGEHDAGLDRLGRYRFNSGSASCSPARVGSYAPNAWGLYDMHGNVSEWCLDWCESLYSITEYRARRNPVGIDNFHHFRIYRGGGYVSSAALCRSAKFGGMAPDGRWGDLGFRIVWNVPDGFPAETWTGFTKSACNAVQPMEAAGDK